MGSGLSIETRRPGAQRRPWATFIADKRVGYFFYLQYLMYLWSPHGQAQLKGLQVGSGVKHISPSTLLSSFQVPAPPLEEQDTVCADFEKLCLLEKEFEQLQNEISKVASHHWPALTL